MTEDAIRKIFAMNLKQFRNEQGLSQLALSSKADIAANFINDIENCKKWVSPATFSKLSEALQVEPYRFFIPIQPTASKENAKNIAMFSTELLSEFNVLIEKITSRYTK